MGTISEEYLIFKISLTFLTYIGFNPMGSPQPFQYIGKFFTLLTFCFMIWIFYGFTSEEMDMQQISKQLQALIIGIFMLTRIFILYYYKDDARSVLNENALKWSPENEYLTNEISLKRVLVILKVLVVLSFISVIVFLSKPWVFGGLPWGVNVGNVNFTIIYVPQFIWSVLLWLLFLGFDSLFVAICVYFINQMRHLRVFFEYLNYSDKDEMRDGVIQHVFLLRGIHKLRRIYSLLFTSQIWVITGMICIETNTDIESSTNQLYVIAHGFILVWEILIFSAHVMLASEITEEGLMMYNAVYNSEWYASDVSARKYVLIVMMRAQMATYFTASGFVQIDREMIIFVLKTAWSFYTVLRSIS